MPVSKGSDTITTYFSIPKDGDSRQGLIATKKKRGEDVIIENYRTIEGYLIDIKMEDGEYEGNPSYKIRFHFANQDFTATDILQIGRYSIVSRDVLNSLMTVEKIGWVRLFPFISSTDIKGNPLPGGKTYTHCSVRHITDINHLHSDMPKLTKKFKDEIPAVVSQTVGKKVVIDDTERNEFFDALVPILCERLIHRKGNGYSAKPADAYVPEDDATEVPF